MILRMLDPWVVDRNIASQRGPCPNPWNLKYVSLHDKWELRLLMELVLFVS